MTRAHDGWTLVEVLIVVIVLGVLAAIVVPQFTAASTDAKLSALKTNLDTIRGQLELYKAQHNGTYPTSIETFVDQMTKASEPGGWTAEVGTPGFDLGPYLQSIPNNPYTGSNTISSSPPGESAWYYEPGTGHFRANHRPDYVDY